MDNSIYLKMIPFIFLLAIILFAFYFFSKWKKRKTRQPIFIDKGLLEENVMFYAKLNDADKVQFEADIDFFLKQTAITGVDISVEELDKLLVAAAAVIPVFHFKEWKYQNLSEVLLYSDAINMNFETSGTSAGRNILGMVGTGAFEGMMLLSRHALRLGFSNQSDKNNTAIHEFVHLLDKADGDTDGIPLLFLDQPYVMPWLDLIHKKMQQIEMGESDINPYAFTNKAEFFAVAAEYFFERPELLQTQHPDLYLLLQKIFIPEQNKRNLA